MIDRALVLKLEHLSRLELTEQEREKISHDLENILKMVDKLNELEVHAIEPLRYLNEDTLPALRKDEATITITRTSALQNAPAHDGVYFKVPKVMDTGK